MFMQSLMRTCTFARTSWCERPREKLRESQKILPPKKQLEEQQKGLFDCRLKFCGFTSTQADMRVECPITGNLARFLKRHSEAR